MSLKSDLQVGFIGHMGLNGINGWNEKLEMLSTWRWSFRFLWKSLAILAGNSQGREWLRLNRDTGSPDISPGPIMSDCSGVDFQRPAAVYQLLPSLLHTYIICISSSGGDAGLEEFSLSRMREIDSGQGGGRSVSSRDLWPLCTGWEDNAWLWGCPGKPVGPDAECCGPASWSLWYCTALHCRAEAAPLWLTFDPGGKNSKEWIGEGPGKTDSSGQTLATGGQLETQTCYILVPECCPKWLN